MKPESSLDFLIQWPLWGMLVRRLQAAQKASQEQTADQTESGETGHGVGVSIEIPDQRHSKAQSNLSTEQPSVDPGTEPPALKVKSFWSSASVPKYDDQPPPTKLRRF